MWPHNYFGELKPWARYGEVALFKPAQLLHEFYGDKIYVFLSSQLQAGGTYFFTVKLADRRSQLLVEPIERLRTVYGRVHQEYPFETVAICVLPEHLHAIWTMPPDDADFSRRWNLIKGNFSRGLPAAPARSASKMRQREKGIWQRRFWEHQIRNEEDLQRHVDYVHFNPVKHGLVKQVADWEFSSFHQWVARGMVSSDWAGDASDGSFGE